MPDNVGSDIDMQTLLLGMAKKAGLNKQYRFRDLYRVLKIQILHWVWRSLKKNAAIADDDITIKEYGIDLKAKRQGMCGGVG